ncbi:MAG: phosphoglycerate kinase [Candidatus Jorgensenbacteria bacterium]
MIRFLDAGVARRYKGKTCLLRIDLNVAPGQPLDTFRLDAVLPTIQLLLKHKVRVVLMSHRGRPALLKPREGRPKIDPALSLQPFVELFAQKLGVPVIFLSHFNFSVVKRQLQWSSRKVFLLENLRFLPGEEENDGFFARQLAGLGDFYVNDAFAVSHRAHASVAAITEFLPSFGGLCLERELESLDYVMKNPKRPFTLILGGAKVGDKLPVLEHFIKKADHILLGSGPAGTFFLAQGLPVGHSLVDRKVLPAIKKLLKSKKIHLPVEVHMAARKIVDIGPRAVEEYAEIIKKSRTILWNGPMGIFEDLRFAAGTKAMWEAILANTRARVVIGGGETLASLATLMPADYKRITTDMYPHKSAKISINPRLFLSTGGGAMLEYLSGKKLPGVEALK